MSSFNRLLHDRSFGGPLAVVLALVVAGCGGSSSSSSNGGSAGAAVDCEATPTLGTGGNRLQDNAGFTGIHYYRQGNEMLCGYDPNSGDSFTVSGNLHDISPVPVFDAEPGGALVENTTVLGVIYASADGTLHYVESGGGFDPDPVRISDEESVDKMLQRRVASDYSSTPGLGNAHLLYNLEGDGWYGTRVDADETEQPDALDGIPLGPVHDTSSGELEGYLVYDDDADEIVRVDLDLNQVGSALETGVDVALVGHKLLDSA